MNQEQITNCIESCRTNAKVADQAIKTYAVYFTCPWYGTGICKIHVAAKDIDDAIEYIKNNGVGFDNGPVFADEIHYAETVVTI